MSVCRAVQEISCLLYIFVEAEAEDVVPCVLNVILGFTNANATISYYNANATTI